MGFTIDDGTGNGFSVEVDKFKRLHTLAIQKTEDQLLNEDGKGWTASFAGINPTAADDYIFYIKNDGDATIHVADFRMSADTAATQLGIEIVTGTAAGGNDVSLVPKTVGNSNLPSATIQTGVDITGLTSGGTMYYMQLPVVATDYHLRTAAKIRIPKGNAIAVSVETGTANITGTISLYEEE